MQIRGFFAEPQQQREALITALFACEAAEAKAAARLLVTVEPDITEEAKKAAAQTSAAVCAARGFMAGRLAAPAKFDKTASLWHRGE